MRRLRPSVTASASATLNGSVQGDSSRLQQQQRESQQLNEQDSVQQQPQQEGVKQQSIPYRAFLRCHAVRVLMFTHFAHNW